MSTIRYIIADDHKIFRKGLRLALSDDPTLHLTGEAANGVELLSLLGTQPADVVLLDLKMPEMDGMEAIRHLHESYPDVKVLILTMHDEQHFILHLMEAGANGYLLKNAEPDEIKLAIYSVCETGFYFNDLVNRTMLRNLLQKNKIPNQLARIDLDEKEINILRLICQEYTAAEIGKQVFLSARTVEGIRSKLLEKIGVRNTAGLVIYSVKNGIYG